MRKPESKPRAGARSPESGPHAPRAPLRCRLRPALQPARCTRPASSIPRLRRKATVRGPRRVAPADGARYRGRVSRLAANAPKMALVRLLFWMHFVASVLVPFFRDWGGLSFSQILLLNAWFMTWCFLLEVPTGAVADRFGRKGSVVSGAALSAGAALLYASTPRYELFLLAELVFALSYALVSGADEALVVDSLAASGRAADTQRAISRLESSKLGGILLGGLAGSGIADAFGLRAPMLAQAAPAAIAAVVALTLVEPPHERAARAGSYRGQLLRGITALRERPALRALGLDLVAHGSLAWLLIWTYQPRLEAAGLPLALFGAVHAALCLAQIAWLQAAPRIEARLFGPRAAVARARLLSGAAAATGVSYLALSATDAPAAVVAAVLACGAFGLTRPVLFAGALHAQIDARDRATVVSTLSMLRTLGVAIVNPIAGLVADRSLPALLAGLGAAVLLLVLATRPAARHLEASAGR